MSSPSRYNVNRQQQQNASYPNLETGAGYYKPHDNGDNHNVEMEMVDIVDPKLVALVKAAPARKAGTLNGPAMGGVEVADLGEIKNLMDQERVGKEEDVVSAFDLDFDDHENMEQAWAEANFVAKAVLGMQNGVRMLFQFLKRITNGYFFKALLLGLFIVYFVVAMCHKFGDEGSHRLLICTVLGVFIKAYPYIARFIKSMFKRVYGSDRLSTDHAEIWRKIKVVIRWFMYVAVLALMVYLLVDEGIKKPRNMYSIPGLFLFLLFCFLFSSRPSKVHWHTIFWGVALQFIFAAFVLKWKFGQESMIWLQKRFQEFFKNAEKGSELVFGLGYKEHLMIFGALPVLLFTNAVFAVLYYLGVMQFIIKCIGKVLKFFLHATAVEAMSVASTIFLEGVATIMVMRPFLQKLSKSELFTVVNGAMSSLGGGYLAILSAFGIPLEHLIPAMLISAPATFAVCKLLVPETREIDEDDAKNANAICDEERSKYTGVVDAAQTGALSMLTVMASVVVIAYTFFTTMTWINHTLGWFGDRVGIDDLSLELIFSYVLYPLALAMGVDPEDCRRVAMLLGYRLGVYNIVAFLKMLEMKGNRYKYMEYMVQTNFTGAITKHRDDITLNAWNMTLTNGYISERSEAIATYALCGFSSSLSAALLMGVICTLVPSRKAWMTRAAIPAIIAGNIANCMTGCFASMFY